ncbi:alpha/beta hydrolase [Knoellia sp. S7-12]|uniref:alpha/beta fold hydrolase n=1 Tax=Knoellia sp. S7-12 TaxID=3126698 RepID=UPI00336872D5
MMFNMTDAHPILFLSGAGLSPWIWDEVRAEVGSDTAVAPRPPQHSNARLADYVESAVGAAPAGRFALVAHSSGGVIGAEIARLLPERVTAFLGISAVIPAAGGSFVSAMPAPKRWVLAAAMRLAGTRPPANAIRQGLGTGLSDDIVERVVREFTPESVGLYKDEVGEHRWSGRRGFVLTTEDKELPLASQRHFAQRLGAQWSQEMATGHLPMLQNSTATAAAIHGFLTA